MNHDDLVKRWYWNFRRGFELLSSPLSNLQAALPSSSGAAANKDSAAVKELRRYMEQVDAIKAEREVMESELKNSKSDLCEYTVLWEYMC